MGDSLYDASIQRNTTSGMPILGGIVGDKAATEDYFRSILRDMEEVHAAMHSIQHSQLEMYLLRACSSYQCINHLLRTTRPSKLVDVLPEFNKLMYAYVQRLIPGTRTELQIKMLHFKSKLGGLGLSDPKLRTHAAYLGAVAQTIRTQSKILGLSVEDIQEYYQPILNEFNELYSTPETKLDWSSDFMSSKSPQRDLSKIVDDVSLALIYKNEGDKYDKVDILHFQQLCTIGKNGIKKSKGNTANIMPIPAYNQKMSSDEYQIILLRRLNAPLIENDIQCPDCNQLLDVYLHHIGSCKRKFTRHQAAAAQVFKVCQEAHLKAKWDPAGLVSAIHVGGGKKRPGDIFIPAGGIPSLIT